MLEEAKRHMAEGRGVIAFLLEDGKKRPALSARDKTNAGVFRESCEKFARHPDRYALALRCGEESNLTLVDIDCKNGKNGLTMWEKVAAEHGHEGLEDAVCATTPSGGMHWYFQFTPVLKHGQETCFKVGDSWADIDIRNKESCGFGLCYPTPGYTWIRSPFDYPLTPCPQWILDWYTSSHRNEESSTPSTLSTAGVPRILPSEKLGVPLKVLRRLVANLPSSCYDGAYDPWLKTLIAIYKVSHDNHYPEEGLQLAHEFSSKSTKYDPSEVEDKWRSFSLAKCLSLGLGTLIRYTGRTFEDVKKTFEETAFKVRHPLQYCIKTSYTEVWSYSRVSFIALHENLFFFNSEGREESFVHAWLKDCDNRTYDEIVFEPPPIQPSKTHKNFNLFTGIRAQLIEPSTAPDPSLKPVLDHMMVMVKHDTPSFNYFLKWCAQRVQQPGKRPKVALTFKGRQGCGKGIFWEWFGEDVLGPQYYFGTAGMRDLTGNFNEGLANRLLIFLDETKTKDMFRDAEELKRLIDAPTLKINRKYAPVMTLNNCAGWVFASNNDIATTVEEGDRRNVAFECSGERKGDAAYFNALGDYLKRNDVVRAFYDYLMAVDIADFHPERDRPTTQFYQDLQEACAPTEVVFIDWLIENDYLEDGKVSWMGGKELEGLFQDFKAEKVLPKEILSSSRFGMAIKKYIRKSMAKGKTRYEMDLQAVRARLVEAGYTKCNDKSFYRES